MTIAPGKICRGTHGPDVVLSFRAVEATGLGGFLADVAVVPVLARTGGRTAALTGMAVVAPMLAKRLLGNRPPARRDAATYAARLVFDRDEWTPA